MFDLRARRIPSASMMLLVCSTSWNDKCDSAFVQGIVARILRFNDHFVRAWGKPHQDDWVAARIGPHPCCIVESHMNVPNPRRDSRHSWPNPGTQVQVLRAIFDDCHSTGSERSGQRRIDEEFRWRLAAFGERNHPGRSTFVRGVLSRGGRRE